MELLKKLLGMHKRPKSAHSFTDSVAVELLRAHLEAKFGEKVYFAHTRIWTEQGADSVDWRRIIIHVQPIVLSRTTFGGSYSKGCVPEVQAEVMFHSCETSVYNWRFGWIGFELPTYFGERSYKWNRDEAADLPALNTLAQNLLARRSGNEVKRYTGADGTRPARVMHNT